MAFHITNFGAFGGRLQPYADLNGFVPSLGDWFRGDDYDFAYEVPNDFDDPDIWQDFVREAVEVRESASQALDEWREENA